MIPKHTITPKHIIVAFCVFLLFLPVLVSAFPATSSTLQPSTSLPFFTDHTTSVMSKDFAFSTATPTSNANHPYSVTLPLDTHSRDDPADPNCAWHYVEPYGYQCFGKCGADFTCLADGESCGCRDSDFVPDNPPPFVVGDVGTSFITSASWPGAMGGLAGADAKCTQSARFAGFGVGEWRAILSTVGNPAFDRMPMCRFYLTNGNLLADGRMDMFDSNIRRRFNIDQYGNNVGKVFAWTGSTRAGNPTGADCHGWRWVGSELGSFGYSDYVQRHWVEYGSNVSCSSRKHLYCVRVV